MRIIYIHGLDSSANSMKGLLLEKYCQTYHPDIEVIRPDLNQSPDKVFAKLRGLIEKDHLADQKDVNKQTVVMGSSLGGYFASLLSNSTGCPAVLLNPSMRPHVSLQRFVDQTMADSDDNDQGSEKVVYRTTGGWAITLSDLDWFSQHKLLHIEYPQQVFAVIKEGDELLDPMIATEFYSSQGVKVALQPGGDHRMTDFEQQLPMIISHILSL